MLGVWGDASQISIIVTKQRWRPLVPQPHPVLDSYPAPRLASFQVGQLGPSERSGAGTAMSHWNKQAHVSLKRKTCTTIKCHTNSNVSLKHTASSVSLKNKQQSISETRNHQHLIATHIPLAVKRSNSNVSLKHIKRLVKHTAANTSPKNNQAALMYSYSKLNFFQMNPLWQIGVALLRLQRLQEQCYPLLPVRAVFSCVHSALWLQCLGLLINF